MYEDISYSGILQRMLDRISDDIDKREGSIVMTTIAPCAMEIFLAYRELDRIILESYADTQSRDYLILRAAERGLSPESATPSVILCKLDAEASLGNRFQISDYTFSVTKDNGDYIYEMTCEQTGSGSNSVSDTVLSLQYIDGLSKIEFLGFSVFGEDEEDTEVFRARYFNFLEAQSFGGNVADYTEKALEINGVSSVKIVPNYDGNGTVKIYISSSDGLASDDLIESVQEAFDPTGEGDGTGLAPIGHVCSVSSVKLQNVDISLNISDNGANTNVLSDVYTAIDNYIDSLVSTWGSSSNIVLRVSQIEAAILDVSGVTDVWDTEINSESRLLTLDPYTIPIRGEIDANFD